LLDAFTKMRKATMSFMSVRPSVFMEQLGSPWDMSRNFVFQYF